MTTEKSGPVTSVHGSDPKFSIGDHVVVVDEIGPKLCLGDLDWSPRQLPSPGEGDIQYLKGSPVVQLISLLKEAYERRDRLERLDVEVDDSCAVLNSHQSYMVRLEDALVGALNEAGMLENADSNRS
jgi:hypothetical protein